MGETVVEHVEQVIREVQVAEVVLACLVRVAELVHNIRKVASFVVAKFLCLIPVYARPIVSKEVASTMLTNFSSIHPAIRACLYIMKERWQL